MPKIVILKKENKTTSYKSIREFKFRGVRYWLYIIIAKIRGYEVEILDYERM